MKPPVPPTLALLAAVPMILLTSPAAVRAQVPADVHWFYEYGGPSSDPFVLARSGHHLYMGGLFLRVQNDTDKKNLARFNLLTEAWEQVPGISDLFNGGVWAIHPADDGSLYIGGNFSRVGGVDASGIARFDPAAGTWSALTDTAPALVTSGQGNGPTNGRVLALARLGTSLYAGGEYTGPSGSPQNEKYIRRFRLDTRKWERLGTGLNGTVRALAMAPNGDLIAGGEFTGGLARWNGTAWSVVAGGVSGGAGGAAVVRALAFAPSGTLFVGGDFDAVNAAGVPVPVRDAASLTGNTWNALAGGFDSEYRQSNGTTFNSDGVYAMVCDAAGTAYAAGDFDASAGRSVTGLRHVAMWDGSGTWKPMGSGVGTTGSQIVNCLAVGPLGDVYAGGVFNIGWGTLGAPAKNFARWLPARDFTGYVPGAQDNTTLTITRAGTTNTVTFLTRPGTEYVLDFSTGLNAWTPLSGTAFTGNGTRQGFTHPAPAGRGFYRFRATDY